MRGTDSNAGGNARLRVLIGDDAVGLREGIALLLEQRGLEVVGQAGDGEELVRLALGLQPDIALVDVRMPPTFTTEGLEAAARIRAERPGIALLVLTQDVDWPSARRLLALGGAGLGYLPKERLTHVGDFVDVVRRVALGEMAFEVPPAVGAAP